MSSLVQILVGVAIAVVSGLAVSKLKDYRQAAKQGRQVDEHKELITVGHCEKCREKMVNEMLAGNALFRLLLEGQALQIQTLIHLCDGDEGCRELRDQLQRYLKDLVSRDPVRSGDGK